MSDPRAIEGLEPLDERQVEDLRMSDAKEVRRLTRLAYSDPDLARVQAKAAGLYWPMIEHMSRAARFFSYQAKQERKCQP